MGHLTWRHSWLQEGRWRTHGAFVRVVPGSEVAPSFTWRFVLPRELVDGVDVVRPHPPSEAAALASSPTQHGGKAPRAPLLHGRRRVRLRRRDELRARGDSRLRCAGCAGPSAAPASTPCTAVRRASRWASVERLSWLDPADMRGSAMRAIISLLVFPTLVACAGICVGTPASSGQLLARASFDLR